MRCSRCSAASFGTLGVWKKREKKRMADEEAGIYRLSQVKVSIIVPQRR